MGYDTSRFDTTDLLDFFQSLGNARKILLSEICTLGKLTLVMPATNAVSERAFSALKQVKTYLRSTTGEGRLIHLMLLHIHKELADGIDMVVVANVWGTTSDASTSVSSVSGISLILHRRGQISRNFFMSGNRGVKKRGYKI